MTDRALAQRMLDELLPKMADSAVVLTLLPPGQATLEDVTMACQVGFALLLDKPTILVVLPGAVAPAKLLAVSDVVIHGEVDTPEFKGHLAEAIREVGLLPPLSNG